MFDISDTYLYHTRTNNDGTKIYCIIVGIVFFGICDWNGGILTWIHL